MAAETDAPKTQGEGTPKDETPTMAGPPGAETPKASAPEAPKAAPPPAEEGRDDKFIRVTKQALLSTERVIEASYRRTQQAIQRSNPRACVRFLDSLLQWVRDLYPPSSFDTVVYYAARGGHIGILAAQILTLCIFFLGTLKMGQGTLFLHGLGLAVLLVALQYSADKFLGAGDRLIHSTPSRLASTALLDCLALLLELMGIVVFFGSVILAYHMGQWSLIFAGLGIWVICGAMAYVALHPAMLNIALSEDVKPGEEALGILAFFAKATLRVVPIAFGIGSIVGAVGMLFGWLGLIVAQSDAIGRGISLPGFAPLLLVVICAALPLASYVLFALYQLIVDLIRALLVLPRKIEELKK